MNNRRAWCVVRGALLVLVAGSATAQTIEQRVAKAPDGSVRFSFAARPGVYGNGRNSISWGCESNPTVSMSRRRLSSPADDGLAE